MKKNILSLTAAGVSAVTLALFPGEAFAASLISGNQITASTNLQSFGGLTIDKIADGITADASPLNGFASAASSGTITLDLDDEYDLNSFILWNDINVFEEGIKDFRLDFFDDSNGLITSSPTFVGPMGQVAGEEYVFNNIIHGVSKVDLVVLNSHQSSLGSAYHRIEVREVAFTGSPTGSSTASTPEPSLVLGFITLGALMVGSKRKSKS